MSGNDHCFTVNTSGSQRPPLTRRMGRIASAVVMVALTVLLSEMTTPNDAYARYRYKYTKKQCDDAFKNCAEWCRKYRRGDELSKCQGNCVDYYGRCMGAKVLDPKPK